MLLQKGLKVWQAISSLQMGVKASHDHVYVNWCSTTITSLHPVLVINTAYQDTPLSFMTIPSHFRPSIYQKKKFGGY
jgi:hypothetical protein